MRRAEVAGGAIFLLMALFAIHQSIGLQLWAYGGPGPGLFPFMLGILLAPMAAFYLAKSVLRLIRAGRAGQQSADGEAEPQEPILWAKVLGYVLCLTAFALAMTVFGVWLSMCVVIFVLLAVVERIGPMRALVFTLLFVLASYLLFERVLAVPLPHGTIW